MSQSVPSSFMYSATDSFNEYLAWPTLRQVVEVGNARHVTPSKEMAKSTIISIRCEQYQTFSLFTDCTLHEGKGQPPSRFPGSICCADRRVKDVLSQAPVSLSVLETTQCAAEMLKSSELLHQLFYVNTQDKCPQIEMGLLF